MQQHKPIRTDEVYTLAEFTNRTGLKERALRTAKRNGLRVVRTAGRAFVRGADWNDYLRKIGNEPQTDRKIGF